MKSKERSAILFVCTGNICRSPTAHALLLHKVRQRGLEWQVDSAAISDEELGHPPDRRAVAEARRRGVDMPLHRARQVRAVDVEHFDLLIGMTASHVAALRRLAPVHAAGKIRLLMDFVPEEAGQDVPDPWYGSQSAFVEAFDMIERGVDGLLVALRRGAAA